MVFNVHKSPVANFGGKISELHFLWINPEAPFMERVGDDLFHRTIGDANLRITFFVSNDDSISQIGLKSLDPILIALIDLYKKGPLWLSFIQKGEGIDGFTCKGMRNKEE